MKNHIIFSVLFIFIISIIFLIIAKYTKSEKLKTFFKRLAICFLSTIIIFIIITIILYTIFSLYI